MDERTYEPRAAVALNDTNTDTAADTDISTTPALMTPHPTGQVSIPLPSTALAACDALEKIAGAPFDAGALAALNAENAALLDMSPDGLMPGLARNLVVMQSLSLKLISDAMTTRNEGARAAFLKTAMAASREAREIVAVLRELKAEGRAEVERVVSVGVA